jgi:acyl carrier protein
MDANRAESYWIEFRTVVAEKLQVPIERVQRESTFAADLKADSLDIVDLLMDFEDRFQVLIPEREVTKLTRAGEFFDYLCSKIESTPS